MSLPYIPGWWDSIDKNALGSFIGGATKAFAPNATAQFEYNNMLKQNPMLATQLSNLDPTQREAFAKSMGFTDYERSPLASLSIGPELQDRMELQDFLKTATPEQKEIRLAGKAGTKTNKEISQSDTIFGQTTKSNEQGIKLNDQKLQLNEMELKEKTEMQTLMDTLKAKYPTENINLQKSMLDFVSGKIQTPELQRIVNDPTLGPAFNNLLDLYKERIRLAAQVNIASLRSPQEKYLGVQFLQQGVDNAQAKVNQATQILKGINFGQQLVEPEKYAEAQRQLQAAQDEHSRYVNAFNSAIEKEFGGKYPVAFNGETTLTPQVNTPAAPNSFLGQATGKAPAPNPKKTTKDTIGNAFARDGGTNIKTPKTKQQWMQEWVQNNPQGGTESLDNYKLRMQRAMQQENIK